jgi:hypothetical protein
MTASGGSGGSGTGSATGAGRGGAARTALAIGAGLVVLLLIGLLTNNHRDAAPYDPRSTSATGTKAFVQTVEHFGAKVTIAGSFPPPDTDIAVMFTTDPPPDRIDEVRRWVAAGHTLVVTSSLSDLAPPGGAGNGPHATGNAVLEQGTCTIAALRDVRTIDRGRSGSFFDGFRVPPDGASCFGGEDEAFVVVEPMGAGQIVSLASGAMFQNEFLGNEDNAALATAIFAPTPGERVAIVGNDAFGDTSSEDLDIGGGLGRIITFGVGLAVLQLGVALVVYALARGRRLGRVVAEPQPVQIAGSELVDAVGNLMLQMKQPNNASGILRADLRRELCTRIGLPPGASPQLIADTVAAQTPIDRESVLRAVEDRPVANDAELIELANQIDTVREEVLHGHAP